MKRSLVLTAIVTFTIGMAGIVAAQPGSGGPCGKGPGQFERGHFGGHCGILGCQKELELTEDQIAKIKEINFDHQNAMIDLRAELKKAQLNMKHVAHADNPTKREVLAAAAEVNSIKGQMAEARIEHKFNLRSVLNKEQLEKWEKCQQECHGRCGSGRKDDDRGFRGDSGCHGHPGMPCDPAKCMGHGPMKHDPGCPQGK